MKAQDDGKRSLTCRPTVMLSRAISFFPALREMASLNLNVISDPFPVALTVHST